MISDETRKKFIELINRDEYFRNIDFFLTTIHDKRYDTMRNSQSTIESLSKRDLTRTDRKWLARIFQKEKDLDIFKLPETVLKKLIGKKLIQIEIKLTDIGKKEAFISALKK